MRVTGCCVTTFVTKAQPFFNCTPFVGAAGRVVAPILLRYAKLGKAEQGAQTGWICYNNGEDLLWR